MLSPTDKMKAFNSTDARNIPPFKFEDFTTYFKSLSKLCYKGIGCICLAQHAKDPITSHIDDPSITSLICKLDGESQRMLSASLPSAAEVLERPQVLIEALKSFMKYGLFKNRLLVNDSENVKRSGIHAAYSELRKSCDAWIESETHVFRVCCESLRTGDMLHLCTDEISANFAGRYLLNKISSTGSQFTLLHQGIIEKTKVNKMFLGGSLKSPEKCACVQVV